MIQIPLHKLLDVERLRILANQALDILYKNQDLDPFDDDEEEYERGSRQVLAALEALRFYASAAVLLRDTSLLPPLVNALAILDGYEDTAYGDTQTLAKSLKALLRQAASAPSEVRTLARHKKSQVRAALAGGLRPVGEEEVALLEELSEDPAADVRNAAKESLAPLREIPWWRGKFSQDPLLSLSTEDAAALGPTFEELALLFDTSHRTASQARRLVELAESLPDAPLFDLAKTCLADYELVRHGGLLPFLKMVLRRRGGGAVLCELLGRWSLQPWGSFSGGLAAQAISGLPVEARVGVCRDLLGFIASAEPPSDRAPYDRNPYRAAAEAVQRAWPKEVDPAPVLEAISSFSESESYPDAAISALGDLFRRKDIDLSPYFDEMSEAYLSRDKGRWRRISFVLKEALDRVPAERLRSLAERALENKDKFLVLWGILQLVGRLHDAARDPAPPLVIQGFFEQPRYHRFFYEHFYDLGLRALPLLRAELRAKSLHFREAAWAMLAIDRVYGGVVDVMGFAEEDKEAGRRKELQEELEIFLGPGELRGPPTEEEWRIYRSARDTCDFPPREKKGEDGWSEALRIFPESHFSPEDREFLARALARWRGGEVNLDLHLAHALATDPLPEYLPILDELILKSDGEMKESFERSKKRAQKKLGCAAEPEVTVAPREWMDDEEEEDDL